MAIRITRIDDIDGSDGAEAIVFELDHKTYEIDLCARNRIRFLRAVTPFIERARLVEGSEETPKTIAIVRRSARDDIDAPTDLAREDQSVSDEVSESFDLIELARQE